MFSNKIHIIWYAIADFLGAGVAWLLFYGLRKYLLNENSTLQLWLQDATLQKGLLLLPMGWLFLYFLSGSYHSLYKKSRLNEAVKLLLQTLCGTLLLFFFVLVDDKTNNYHYFTKAFFLLFALHYTCTLFLRSVLLTLVKWQINTNRFFYKTILIDDSIELHHFWKNATATKWSAYKVVGYIAQQSKPIELPYLGNIQQLEAALAKDNYQEVIIGNTKDCSSKEIIATLLGKNLSIKIIPTDLDFITGAVKTTNVLGTNLIEVKNVAMPEWQQNFKRLFDIAFAIFLSILLAPLILLVWLRTLFASNGKALYAQERLGYHGKPFTLYKFRSMHLNAEAKGIQLSSEQDVRITHWGKVMRKWRLDELPQLWNIIKGEMSFVGPRPERAFYAVQLLQQNSYYKIIYEMKPGLTSWGMVKYGYAENVAQMLERLQYDFIYANNASLLLDAKIMLHTVRIIFLGKGK